MAKPPDEIRFLLITGNPLMSISAERLLAIVEGALLAAGQPLPLERIEGLFDEVDRPSRDELRTTLGTLTNACVGRGVELVEVASGWRYQVRRELSPWVGRLWEERPIRYSRALLETLALMAYRQPVTRAEIEDVRGVAVSSSIIKTLLEREWVRVVGHREVPGRPALYATTKRFLDYFNLKGLDDLPPLTELRDLSAVAADLERGVMLPSLEEG
ncbi:Segregation and condensation protein B homolog [Gammaproteobacteria bacterium]